MNGFAFFVGGVLPYIAVPIFVIGMIYRLWAWKKSPQPGKMTLFPAPSGVTGGTLSEILFFPSLFRGDKALWFFSWTFHVALALIAVGHLRVVTGLIDSMLGSFGMSAGGINAMSTYSGTAAGFVMMASGGVLLLRRLATQRVREITSFGDIFALLLILGVVVTGNMMRVMPGAHVNLADTRVWIASVVTFSPAVKGLPTMFLLHALLGQLVFIYIPFSKILHLGGIFFTQPLIQRR
jgi:nitrate reductase gamma subunit